MLTRIAPTLRPFSNSLRALSTSASRFSGAHSQGPVPRKDPSSPATTQGHATRKPLKKDIQSEYVSQGKENRHQADGSGEDQPLDAARMDGGEAKPAEGKGPWKDQVGGQEGGLDQGGDMGKTEDAAGEGTGNKVKKALGMKSSRNFSTSARSSYPTDDLSGARQPKSPEVKGDQNPHLKHSSSESKDAGKGNAGPEPHLPSKSKQTSSGSATTGEGRKMFSTSARVGTDKAGKAGKAGTYEGEAGEAGYAVPPEALPHKLSSAYSSSEAAPPPPAGHTPSSETEYSSTARDPPNSALKEKVLKGDMPDKNPQPNTKFGEIGLDEAWKSRKP